VTSTETLAKVERPCADLLQNGDEVSLTSGAALSGISRTSLYRGWTMHSVVAGDRTHSHDPRTIFGLASEGGHLRTAVEALAERVRHHDERLCCLGTVWSEKCALVRSAASVD
jgi:hypothetical protein